MDGSKCLYCYRKLERADLEKEAGKSGFHEGCSKKFFEKKNPPLLNLTEKQIFELAEYVVKSQKTITGVQAKLSLGITENTVVPDKFTIVGLWGEYILKPQSRQYKNLPENESLTMHLAQISKISTVEHSLIKLKSGQLAYITKRIDRYDKGKFHMEDMCQLTERLTEYKYKGSYEQIAKTVNRYSATPGLDVINFFEIVLFSFLTGNNDMHLKNFSLLKKNNEYNLCPAYDLLSSALVTEGDDEELALTLNAKKRKIRKQDFETAMSTSGIDKKVIDNIFNKYKKLIREWPLFIDYSFLPIRFKKKYKEMVIKRAMQLELI